MNVLIVDDDKDFCELLATYLTQQDFSVDSVHDGPRGLERARDDDLDIVILDVMLPGMNGVEVLRSLRQSSQIPVLMLTARGDDVDRIVGLELGADDYLPKPCNPREVVARLRAILRRTQSAASPAGPMRVADLVLDPAARVARCDDEVLDLTSTEFSMLETLMRSAGKVVSKETLSEEVLGRRLGRYDRAIDMHMSNLRRKVGTLASGAERFETVRGVGYQMIVPGS